MAHYAFLYQIKWLADSVNNIDRKISVPASYCPASVWMDSVKAKEMKQKADRAVKKFFV